MLWRDIFHTYASEKQSRSYKFSKLQQNIFDFVIQYFMTLYHAPYTHLTLFTKPKTKGTSMNTAGETDPFSEARRNSFSPSSRVGGGVIMGGQQTNIKFYR